MAVLISLSNRNIRKPFSFQRFCGKMQMKHKIYVKGDTGLCLNMVYRIL
jgi:hypothetical protein